MRSAVNSEVSSMGKEDDCIERDEKKDQQNIIKRGKKVK